MKTTKSTNKSTKIKLNKSLPAITAKRIDQTKIQIDIPLETFCALQGIEFKRMN